MNIQPTDKSHNHAARSSHDNNTFGMLVLTEDGVIQCCNDVGVKLLGYQPENLTKRHISEILPQLSGINLSKGERVNPYLRFLSRVGYEFSVVGNDGRRFLGELFFNDLENHGQHRIVVMIRPIRDKRGVH